MKTTRKKGGCERARAAPASPEGLRYGWYMCSLVCSKGLQSHAMAMQRLLPNSFAGRTNVIKHKQRCRRLWLPSRSIYPALADHLPLQNPPPICSRLHVAIRGPLGPTKGVAHDESWPEPSPRPVKRHLVVFYSSHLICTRYFFTLEQTRSNDVRPAMLSSVHEPRRN